MFEKVCTDFDIEIAGILASTNNVIPESDFGDYIVSMKEANELHQTVQELEQFKNIQEQMNWYSIAPTSYSMRE